MARKTVKVDIPRTNPDDMLTLIQGIITEDGKRPAAQKLPAAIITALQGILDDATPVRAEAKDFEAKAQEKNQQVRTKLGMAEGQTLETTGTGLFLVTDVRDKLLNQYKGNEEALSTYTFNVVIGSFAPKGRKKK